MFDIPGMTELYGPGTGLECTAHDGMHYWADYYLLEISTPSPSNQPCRARSVKWWSPPFARKARP